MNPSPSIDSDLAFKLFRAGRDTVWSGPNPDRIVGAIMEAVDGRADQARLRELAVELIGPPMYPPGYLEACTEAAEKRWRKWREENHFDDLRRKSIREFAKALPIRNKRWDRGDRERLGMQCNRFHTLLSLTFDVKGKRESWADRLCI